MIVLGDELTKILFPGRPALGASILINGLRFEVVGSMPQVGRGDDNCSTSAATFPTR